MNTLTCSLCNKKVMARGWCSTHYHAWNRYGDPLSIKNASGSPEDRLRFYGWTITESGCWEWNGSRNKSGYGVLNIENKILRVHRLAYTTWVGPIPEGQVVRHKCDNPPCMNPEHLELGTQNDNLTDIQLRGHHSRGEDRYNSKLNARQVLDIRKRYSEGCITQKTLSLEYKVSVQTIAAIIQRRNWKHV